LSTQEYNHIVRIVGNDIPGEKKITIGLTQIKGIGYNFATAILDTLKINPNSNVGYLTDADVQAIEKLITDPSSSNFPQWFLNRRKDVETGNDIHILTSDIDFTLRNDIERERITSSWRGYRHMYGLKVRGQRTRCTGRKGGAVGVAKGGKVAPVKSAGPGAVAAPTGEAAAPAAATDAPAAAPAKKETSEKKE
jgi:small subunit ribosomal protein S13